MKAAQELVVTAPWYCRGVAEAGRALNVAKASTNAVSSQYIYVIALSTTLGLPVLQSFPASLTLALHCQANRSLLVGLRG